MPAVLEKKEKQCRMDIRLAPQAAADLLSRKAVWE